MSKILLGIHLDDAERLEWNTKDSTSPLHVAHEYAYKISTIRVLNLDTLKIEDTSINNYSEIIGLKELKHTESEDRFTFIVRKIQDYYFGYRAFGKFLCSGINFQIAMFKNNELVKGCEKIVNIQFRDKYRLHCHLVANAFGILYRNVEVYKEIEDIRYTKNVRLEAIERFCENTSLITRITDYTDKFMDDNIFIERVEQDILIPFGIKRVILNLDFGKGKHNVVFPKSLSELYLFAGSLSDCFTTSKGSGITLYVPSELEDLVMGKFNEIDYKAYNIDIKDSIIETINSVGVLVKTY